MTRIENTIFISYRRTDVYTALAVYENLKNQGYDIFFDYRSISSGDFEQIIAGNIRARAHFLLILTPTALDRCNEPEDWLRREIELAINEKRNIVPMFFKGFRFGVPSVTEKLTGKLKNLSRYNGLNVHEDYFDEAMHRLRTQYLTIPLNTVIHPVSTEVRKLVREEQIAADKALEQIENVQELVKKGEERPAPANQGRVEGKIEEPRVVLPRQIPSPKTPEATDGVQKGVVSRQEQARQKSNVHLLRFGAIGFFVLVLCVTGSLWASNRFVANSVKPSTTPSINLSMPSTDLPSATSTLDLAGQIATANASTLSPEEQQRRTQILSTVLSNLQNATRDPETGKDGMLLLYVYEGEFTMGSDNGEDDERPAHSVSLNAFWIDRTEVTNQMYSLCVSAGQCEPPRDTDHFTNEGYSNHPVVHVSWNDARDYCSWAGRRLPTEAEWEKAARGPSELTYPWGNENPNSGLLNYNNEINETTEVGNYPDGASPYGALDMAGNVLEWVADWYSEIYYASSPAANPTGPELGTGRVLRGGSWGGFIESASRSVIVRAAYRRWGTPDYATDFIGFRCADTP